MRIPQSIAAVLGMALLISPLSHFKPSSFAILKSAAVMLRPREDERVAALRSTAVDVNRFLPVLITATVALIVFGAVGLMALSWTKSAGMRLLIKRAMLVLLLLAAGAPLLYWFMTVGVEGTPRHEIDRSLQQQQQDELHQRIHKGGH